MLGSTYAVRVVHRYRRTPISRSRKQEDSMDPVVRVVDFDHIVLNVADAERSLRFYCHDLGLEGVRVDEWRRHEALFPSVRVNSRTIIDLLEAPRSGQNSDHFCLVVEPTDFEALKATGRFDVVEGPASRYGAQGDGMSLYVKDPDANVVELRYYQQR